MIGRRELCERVAACDDAELAVFGDWLAERGDERGELIGLALRGARSTRLRELEARCRASWLGPVAGAVHASQTVFGRGIPIAVTLDRGSDGLAGCLDDPLWGILEEVDLDRLAVPRARAVVERATRIRRLSGALDMVVTWLTRARPPRLEALGCHLCTRRLPAGRSLGLEDIHPIVQAALLGLDGIVELRHGDRMRAAAHAWLWPTPLAGRLRRLSVPNIRDDRLIEGPLALASFHAALAAAPPSLARFELTENEDGNWRERGWTAVFTRGADGALSALTMRWARYPSRITPPLERLVAGLEELPGDALTGFVLDGPLPKAVLRFGYRGRMQRALDHQRRLRDWVVPELPD